MMFLFLYSITFDFFSHSTCAIERDVLASSFLTETYYKVLPSAAKGQAFEASRELSVNWHRVTN